MASGKHKEKDKDTQKHKKKQKQKHKPSLGLKSTTKTQKQLKKSKNLKAKRSKDNENGITKVANNDSNISKEKQNDDVQQTPTATASQQLSYFIQQYQSANGVQLSSLELDSLTETSMVELCQDPAQHVSNLGEYMKVAFGESWREVLYEKQVQEGKVDPGSPALLVISSSAIRSLELLRELRPLTEECKAAKLFAKHMKIEEQVSFLKNRVNVASGTPSRIKKLIDTEALGLSRLSVVVLDLHADVKGYSLLTLPQVRDEFWDLYRSYFHQRLLDGDLRICLYGKIPDVSETRKTVDAD